MNETSNKPRLDDTAQPPDAVTMGGDRTPLRLSREDIANLEVGQTDISARAARAFVIAFLFIVLSVPIVQHLVDALQQRTPVAWQVSNLRPQPPVPGEKPGFANNFNLLPTAAQLTDFERLLEERSITRHLLLGPAQSLLTRWLNVGNEEAFIGSDGYLFYRPGVEYLTGQPFLNPARLEALAKLHRFDPAAPQPDPVAAIVQFRDELAARGITLVLMPTTVKPMLHPDKLSGRYPANSPAVQNPSYEPFLDAMRDAGVHVFDPTPLLQQRRDEHGDAFLKTDTHWSAPAMDAVARALADYLVAEQLLPPAGDVAYTRSPRDIANHGDIVTMLKLPAGQTLYPPETTTIQPVQRTTGEPWSPRVDAPLLLLGDSFSNIYALDGMGWGTHAGLAPTLSYHLQQPVDFIAENAGGAFRTRELLAQQLRIHYAKAADTGKAPTREKLADKQVVVWQFAMRELAVGNWKRIDLPAADPAAFGEVEDRQPDVDADTTVLTGRIAQITRPPRPGSVPYKDAVIAIHLTSVAATQGKTEGSEAVVFLWGMRDNVLTEAADWQPGRSISLTVTPWSTAMATYGSYQRFELDDPDFELELLPMYWGQP